MRRIGGAAVAILGGCLALACGGEENTIVGRDFQDLPADQVMFGSDYDIRDMGILRARLHSDTAYVFEDSASVLWRPVELLLFDVDGTQTANLTSREGTLD